MPGYTNNFADLVGRHVFCPLCQKPMRDPVRITSCGHRFCDTCLQDYLSDGVFKCPVDYSQLDYAKIYPDPELHVEIMESLVRCVHYKDGCRWMDKLHLFQGHLETCRYDAVPCPNECPARLSRMCVSDHVEYTCPRRRIVCESCNKEFSGEAMESHQGNCPQEVVWCENKCGARLQRRYLSNHMRNECHKRTTPCPYCAKQFVFETLQNHYYQCPRFPVTCPNRCDPAKIPREDVDIHIKDSCPSAMVACTFRDAGCKHTCPRFSLDKHLDEATKRHLVLMGQLVMRQESVITDLSAQLEVMARVTDGTFIWKIPNFKARMAESKTAANNGPGLELKSDPFYTSRYGYKLGASVFLYGNGSGESTHLSLYIRVLAGEYDNLLDWPFRLPISFCLVDQCSDPEKRASMMESFVPNPSWKHFQKPSPSEEAEPMGFGYPRFLTHETLKNGTYIRDDAIFVKIKVDTSKFIIP